MEILKILGDSVPVIALAGLLWKRLDRIEDKMDKELGEVRAELRRLAERVARIEGAALFRPADAPVPASGD